MMLEKMELPYDGKTVELPKAKQEIYVKRNPNDRLPTIEDPKTGSTLWEVY